MNPHFVSANALPVAGFIRCVLFSAGVLALPFCTHLTNMAFGGVLGQESYQLLAKLAEKQDFDSFAKVQNGV